jgi:hypothetical protein
MLVELIAQSPPPAWQGQIRRQPKPARASAPVTSFNQPDDDIDPDPPAMRPWPRVFPGL